MFVCIFILIFSVFLQSSEDYGLPFAYLTSEKKQLSEQVKPQLSLYDFQDDLQRLPVTVYDTSPASSAIPVVKRFETQIVHIPVESRCSRKDFFSVWADSQGLDKFSKSVQGSFARQYDHLEKIEIPRGKVLQDGDRMVDPSVRFLYSVMAAEFKRDQMVQLQTANSGNVFLGRAPRFRSLDKFIRFQFRQGGPQTLTVTKTGREILASLVVQYPVYPALLTRFAKDKKIAPVCLEKMQELAIDFSSQLESMKIDGRYR